MTVTYPDSGVLIALATSDNVQSRKAYDIINESKRIFASTALVELEVLPKAIFHQRHNEVGIYQAYFANVGIRVQIDEELLERALLRAAKLGLSALDALHLEAAISAKANEFITTERVTKPLFRETEIQVRTLA